jgi:hypothetical protein
LRDSGGIIYQLINVIRSYNNLIPIEYLPSNTDFFVFKDYIKPEWEDCKNKKGGRWIYDIAWDKSKHHLISQHTEQVWLKLVLIILIKFNSCYLLSETILMKVNISFVELFLV